MRNNEQLETRTDSIKHQCCQAELTVINFVKKELRMLVIISRTSFTDGLLIPFNQLIGQSSSSYH